LLGAFALAAASGEPFDAEGLAAVLAAGVGAQPEAPAPHWGA